jgi:membrane glycosyltransferase
MIVNNAVIPSDWRKAIVVPIYREDDCSLVSNYRLVSLTPVVSKQMEHVTASYLREIWDKKVWIYEGQHGFRPDHAKVK